MSVPADLQPTRALNLTERAPAASRKPVWLLGALALCGLIGLILYHVTPALYFARIPLMAFAIFGVLLPLLTINNLRSLLIGAYDLTSTRAAVGLGLLLVLCGMTIYTTATLDMHLGPARASGGPPTPQLPWKPLLGATVWAGILANAILACWASACFEPPDGSEPHQRSTRWHVIAGLAGGVSAAAILWWVLESVVVYLQNTIGEAGNVPQGIALLRLGFTAICDWLRTHNWNSALQGYVGLGPADYRVELEHLGAIVGLVATAWIYRRFRRHHLVPIGYVLLLLVVLTWGLSALGFFLEPYRIPLVVPIGFWLFFAAFHPKTDHYYRIDVSNREAFQPPTPADILGRAAENEEPVILIAAAGGGIQSAAWTAQVLTGLEEYFGDRGKCSFAHAVRLLSGVSGGSVGSMFFAAAYRKQKAGSQGAIPPALLERVREAASASSLSEAAQGFAYSDLLRAVAPLCVRKIFKDRGRALEQAWMKNAGWRERQGKDGCQANPPLETLHKATLRDWQKDVMQGIRPATIFNATVVETGQRLAFSTAPCGPCPQDSGGPVGVIEFSQQYAGADIRISTAARLSATFTYVSPAARPLAADSLDDNSKPQSSHELNVKRSPYDPDRFHLVDGGYHEGSGLGGLVAWLTNGLQSLEAGGRPRPKEILIVTISAFPPASNSQNPGQQGAIFQFEAPFLTFANMQGQVHSATAYREFDFLKELWATKSPSTRLNLVNFTVPPEAARPPLSWHLRTCDKQAIKTSWDEVKRSRKPAFDAIAQFLGATES